jgi:hypothetical protein
VLLCTRRTTGAEIDIAGTDRVLTLPAVVLSLGVALLDGALVMWLA